MKIIPLFQLCQTDYNVLYLGGLKQFWKNGKSFSCINQPKKQSILLFLDGCCAKYTTKTGKKITAKSGDVIYAPQSSEYTVTFFNFTNDQSHTIGVNFFLLDENNSNVILSDEITVFENTDNEIKKLFSRIATLCENENSQPWEFKVLLYKTLNALSFNISEKQSLGSVIDKGVEFLNSHYFENPSVKHLAKLCFVSEVYFRRIFKEKFGISPIEYKNLLRMKKAKQYLDYGEISINEISDSLGYATVSHFIKQFKTFYGLSPLSYRNQNQ